MTGHLPPQAVVPYATALFMGITAGISHCSVMCAPVVGTYIMGSRPDVRSGIKSFAVFTAGRVFVYAALGMVSGVIGRSFIDSENGLRYAGWFYSVVLVSIGLLMLARPVQKGCGCRKENGVSAFLSRRFAFNPTAHMFAMGAAFSMIPCPPMTVMLVFSLGMPSAFSGGVVMSLFGIGTALSPLLIICALAGWFSGGVRRGAPPGYAMLFQRVSGAILIFLGCVPQLS